MTDNLNNSRNYLMIRLPVKWTVFFILGISLIAGVATIAVRFEHLHDLAATYYHSYLVRAGFSDNFYVWYLLLPEILLALSFAATGAIVALHRPATWMTIFAAIALILFGISVPPPLHALVVQQGTLALPLQVLHCIGLALFIVFFYVFPDGRFVPRWTKILAIVLVGWALLCPFFPALNPYQLPHPFPFVVLSSWLFTGVAAQLYRYFRLTEPDQQQQTKWVVFGITISVLGDFITHIPWYIWSLQEGADWQFVFLHHPFFILSQLLVPLSIGVSISRFGLWEIDFIINQTLIYGLLMTLVAAGWATLAKVLEKLFDGALGESAAPLATGLAVLVVGLAFGTTRKYLETVVNHYFFPNKMNPSRDFVEFLPEARSTIGSSELLEILLCRTLERFKITHGVVLLSNIEEKEPQLVSVGDIEPETVESLEWDDQLLNQIHQGLVMRRPNDRVFPLLVPLVLRHSKQPELLGVLALGPLKNGRQYSLNELWMFKQLASQAGTAVYISQLNTANYQKLKQKINKLEQRITLLSEGIAQGRE